MKVEVNLQGAEERLRRYVEHRLLSQVGDLHRALTQVTACVAILPGGRYRCRLVTHPWAWASLAVEEEDGDAYAAVDLASSRLERAVRAAMRLSEPGGPQGTVHGPRHEAPAAG